MASRQLVVAGWRGRPGQALRKATSHVLCFVRPGALPHGLRNRVLTFQLVKGRSFLGGAEHRCELSGNRVQVELVRVHLGLAVPRL
ncbi:MAG: hypothetical protein K0Q61_2404 [Rhodococcus erythropolis]|nr:hypothetical protein [Rhodococcus erythropolis]